MQQYLLRKAIRLFEKSGWKEDIMLDFGHSTPDTVEKICKKALGKMRRALIE